MKIKKFNLNSIFCILESNWLPMAEKINLLNATKINWLLNVFPIYYTLARHPQFLNLTYANAIKVWALLGHVVNVVKMGLRQLTCSSIGPG